MRRRCVRWAAEPCATTHRTMKRVVERWRAGIQDPAAHPRLGLVNQGGRRRRKSLHPEAEEGLKQLLLGQGDLRGRRDWVGGAHVVLGLGGDGSSVDTEQPRLEECAEAGCRPVTAKRAFKAPAVSAASTPLGKCSTSL